MGKSGDLGYFPTIDQIDRIGPTSAEYIDSGIHALETDNLSSEIEHRSKSRPARPSPALASSKIEDFHARLSEQNATQNDYDKHLDKKLSKLPSRLQYLFTDLAAFMEYSESADESTQDDLWEETLEKTVRNLDSASGGSEFTIDDQRREPFLFGYNIGSLVRFLFESRADQQVRKDDSIDTELLELVRGFLVGGFGEEIDTPTKSAPQPDKLQSRMEIENEKFNKIAEDIRSYHYHRKQYCLNNAIEFKDKREKYFDNRLSSMSKSAIKSTDVPQHHLLKNYIIDIADARNPNKFIAELPDITEAIEEQFDEDVYEYAKSVISADVNRIDDINKHQGVDPAQNLKTLRLKGRQHPRDIASQYNGQKTKSVVSSFNRMSSKLPKATWTEHQLVSRKNGEFELTGYGYLIASWLIADDLTKDSVATIIGLVGDAGTQTSFEDHFDEYSEFFKQATEAKEVLKEAIATQDD
jgi:hypothetical protein